MTTDARATRIETLASRRLIGLATKLTEYRRGRKLFDSARNVARNLPFYPHARSVYRRFRKDLPRHPLQDLIVDERFPLRRLGTDYGGWTFVDTPNLHGATVISAGLGEDASFDVEFANAYDAHVIVVDPTPRAIAHYESFIARLGNGSSRAYAIGGNQPVESYDLAGLSLRNFTLVPKALWESRTRIKFFEPANSKHVSYSIINFQRGYVDNTKFIEVETLTTTDLLKYVDLGPENLPLIKLDIEGAEVEVIVDFLSRGVRPEQILVEFDELNSPSLEAFRRIDYADENLKRYGYRCIWTDGQADFLYIQPEIIRGQLG